jgi:hypothetical protein
MPVTHAYTTFVADSETELYGEVGTINLEALADQDLAAALRDGDYSRFIDGLAGLSVPGEIGEPELQVRPLEAPVEWLSQDQLPGRLAAFLSSGQIDEAVQGWYNPLGPGDPRTAFAVSLLDSTVLAEHSDAAAIGAGSAVGVAAIGGGSHIVVAIVAAGSVGGVGLLIAGPVGIVVLGVGAGYAVYRLFKGKRRNG